MKHQQQNKFEIYKISDDQWNGRIKFKDLQNLNIKIWNGQRQISTERVYIIARKIINDYEIKKHIFVPNPIALIYYKNNYYIIDGQHRFQAILYCLKCNISDDFYIPISLFYPKMETDIWKYYSILNDIEEQPLIHMNKIENKIVNKEDGNDLIISEQFQKLISNKYTNVKNDKCIRPNVNINFVCESLKEYDIINKYNIESAEQLLIYFDKLNDMYYGKTPEYFINKTNFTRNKAEMDNFNKFHTEIKKTNGDKHMLGIFIHTKNNPRHKQLWISDLETIID